MPLHNWIQCNEGNTEYVRKGNTKDEGKDDIKWIEIYDQYVQKYGLSDVYKRLLEVMKKKALYELEYVITKEKFKITEIELQEAKLKTMLSNNGKGITIEQSLIHLSKWLGYRLNPMKITVVEYFNTLKEYGKENKQK